MSNQKLSYPEKLQLLSELKEFYMKDFWNIYDDIPEELWRLKWLSIWLVLDLLTTFFSWNQEPSKEEIILVLTHILNQDFLDDIYSKKSDEEVCFIKAWFWWALGILLWDKKIINKERAEIEKIWWVEINCNLM